MNTNTTELNLEEMNTVHGGIWPILVVLYGATVIFIGNEIYNSVTGNDE